MTDSSTLNTQSENVILFVGSNPSEASEDETAFHSSTKSSKVLTQWCEQLIGIKMHINVLNKKTEGNRPLKTSEVEANLEQLQGRIKAINPTHIVALGKTASSALSKINASFYEMPHPSGRNRLLNDATYVEEKVKGLIAFVNKPNRIES